MNNILKLGWDTKTLGEIDHRAVKAPYIRLTSYKIGNKGDVTYVYDLRINQPNTNYMTTRVLHSFEHLLLAGFRKYLEKNFVSVAPMGCQTGFYLILINYGNADKLCNVYNNILHDIIKEKDVPYKNIHDCGQYLHHDLNGAKKIAEYLINNKDYWLEVL